MERRPGPWADPETTLAALHARLKPGGVMLVDWLHGTSRVPVPALELGVTVNGVVDPFVTTYVDEMFLARHRNVFEAFLRHVRRPPRRGWRQWFRRPRGLDVTHATYQARLAENLARANKRLVTPAGLVYRDAHYLYPATPKFNVYLLTVLTRRDDA